MIEEFAKYIPESLKSKSGSVFYSGRNAFTTQADLYILGLNPGGSPIDQASETVEWHTRLVLREKPDDWSEFQDESWLGTQPGTFRSQPRVLHLLRMLGLNPHHVPASNLIFQRSAGEDDLKGMLKSLADECWPFHQNVIDQLGIKTVLCFGGNSGRWVCRKLNATRKVGEFTERNKRYWKSEAYLNPRGVCVIVASHPSRADWRNPSSDPSPLVKRSLARDFS